MKYKGGQPRSVYRAAEKRKRYYARHPEKQHAAARARGYIK